MPPRNWLDTVEKEEGKKILSVTVKAEEDTLVLNPMFENPLVEAPHNSSPELLMVMLKEGTVISKLREIHKGGHLSRIINIPRAWVRAKEQNHKRKVIGLRLTLQPRSIIVVPVFANSKIHPLPS
jgi:hypothetical protein